MNFRMRAVLFAAAFLIMLMMAMPAAAAPSAATAKTTAATTAATTVAATTEGNESSDSLKSFVITESDGKGKISEQPDSMTFWEYPKLPAGQLREGTLKIVNQSDKAVTVSLNSVDVPYNNKNALTYLASLHITISQDGGVTLYDGAYSGICDENGLSIKNITLQPDESRSYHISLRCAFTYTGDPAQTTSRITWHFKASSLVEKKASDIPKILITAVLILLAVSILLALIQWIRCHKMKKHAKH